MGKNGDWMERPSHIQNLRSSLLYSRRHESESSLNVWPGFVDALTALVVVLMFVVLVFVVSQYYLTSQLTGQSESTQALAVEVDRLNALIEQAHDEHEHLQGAHGTVLEHLEALSQDHEALGHEKTSLEAQLEALQAKLAKLTKLLEAKSTDHADILAQHEQVKAQHEEVVAQKESLEAQLARLTKQLDKTLEAEQLAHYKSEFFGRLKEALAGRTDMVVVGDRFMFQSELLFPSGSAELEPLGKTQLAILAQSLKQILKTLPKDLNWILRIDGHTDDKPIHTSQFNSNWELSAARAMSVVTYLIKQGIPPNRLAATGFGEYQPLSAKQNNRNRRIELRIDQK